MLNNPVDVVVILVEVNNISSVECLDAGSRIDNGDGTFTYPDVYQIPDFGTDEFNEIEARIREKTCSGMFPA